MEKPIITHLLSLDMSNQAVQATITLAQWDQAVHRLIVTLRHGAEPVELPPGSYAIAVQNTKAGVDVLDSVTVCCAGGEHHNCIVYDVTPAVTETEGYHEGQFLISCVDENGSLKSFASPRIAFVVKPDILRSSDVKNSQPYNAVVAAQAAAEKARDEAQTAAAEAAESKEAAAQIQMQVEGAVIVDVSLTEGKGLDFELANGEHLYTDSVQGEPGYTPQRGTDYWTAEDVAAIVASAVAQIREEEHGVGSWLFTDDPTDPAEKYGGKWEQIADRSLVGAGGKYAVGDTGGVDEVALTSDQMPSHNHNPIGYGSWGDINTDHGGPGFTADGHVYVCSAASRSDTWPVGMTGYTGGNEAHENRSPFHATYIWHRFA